MSAGQKLSKNLSNPVHGNTVVTAVTLAIGGNSLLFTAHDAPPPPQWLGDKYLSLLHRNCPTGAAGGLTSSPMPPPPPQKPDRMQRCTHMAHLQRRRCPGPGGMPLRCGMPQGRGGHVAVFEGPTAEQGQWITKGNGARNGPLQLRRGQCRGGPLQPPEPSKWRRVTKMAGKGCVGV